MKWSYVKLVQAEPLELVIASFMKHSMQEKSSEFGCIFGIT